MPQLVAADIARLADGDILCSHVSTNFDRSSFPQDLNVMLPRARLVELEREGVIGKAADTLCAFMGATSPVKLEDRAREVGGSMLALGVNTIVLAQAKGLASAQLQPLLQRLVREGHLVRLSAKLWLSPSTLCELQGLVVRLQQSAGDGEFSVAEFRDASGIGRNRCIEILESFDARGITRRGERGRRLLPAADGAFAKLQAAAG